MIFHKRIIEYEYPLPVRLAIFSDTHFGSRYFSRKNFVKWVKSQVEKPQTYFIGVGDNIEAITTKDKRFTMDNLDMGYYERYFNNPDSKYYNKPDLLVNAQKDDCVETLSTYIATEQWLGLGRGNHDDDLRIHGNDDPQSDIAERLGTIDLGWSWLLCLVLRPKNENGRNGRTRTVRIYGTHGWGGGARTSGGDITKFERLLIDYEADIYVTGHTHKPFAMPSPRIMINNAGKMQERDRWLANAGSFKKLLSDNSIPSWSEKKTFRVVKLGGLVFEITPKHEGWVDIISVN